MKNQNPAWLDQTHPNFKRWQGARELSIERGKFVRSIINQKVNKNNLCVLDLGSGEGGTRKVFSVNNLVVSFDLSLIRLQRQKEVVISKEGSYPTEESFENNFVIPSESALPVDRSSNEKSGPNSTTDSSGGNATIGMTFFNLVNGTALQLPFSDQAFDLIIIQDVIEHITDVNGFYVEIKRVLKSEGTIYLSTPNKLSVFNFFSDPHFGLPVVSILNRKSIKKYFLRYFRKDDYERTDIAQLFSLTELINLFQKDFGISLHTKFSVEELFNGNKGIVWSKFHHNLIGLCRFIKLDSVLIKIANDSFGILNKYFTSTFYIILKKLT